MRKLKKFIKKPFLFLRDYLINKYPLSFDEQGHSFDTEEISINNDLKLFDRGLNNNDDPVDVVISWVNCQDPNWKEQFLFYKKQISLGISPLAIDDARFQPHGELKYVINSILRFLPWVNCIYLVTNNQVPNFSLPHQVIVVDHSDFIDKALLPTFNSHVIEAYLHKIPNLSDNFIYFNDDVFVCRPLPKSHFFRGNNITSLFVNRKNLDDMVLRGISTPTLSASLNSRKLLLNYYGKDISIPLAHTYFPLRKKYYEKAWEIFNEPITGFVNNRFRSDNDLNLATFLVPWMMYLESNAVFARDICYYFNIRSPSAPFVFNTLLSKKKSGQFPHSMCANDFLSNSNSPSYFLENLDRFLCQYFEAE